jgi:hypothetical protein
MRERHLQLVIKTITSLLDIYYSIFSIYFRNLYAGGNFLPYGYLNKVCRNLGRKVDGLYIQSLFKYKM